MLCPWQTANTEEVNNWRVRGVAGWSLTAPFDTSRVFHIVFILVAYVLVGIFGEFPVKCGGKDACLFSADVCCCMKTAGSW